MRSRSPLALMEQLVMVLVFALAAALCVQAFALSEEISRTIEARDRAILLAQNAAELLKSTHGDFAQVSRLMGGEAGPEGLVVCYDEDWASVEDPEAEYAYAMTVSVSERERDYLDEAHVTVIQHADNVALVEDLAVAWQTEGVDGDAE